MQRRTNAQVMWRMLGLVKPLAAVMAAAVACGVAGFCCAIFLPVLAGAQALAIASGAALPLSMAGCVVVLAVLAIARGVLHYVEQSCNHYIAFKLLAHVRSLVFGRLRELSPAKLAGADRGGLVSTLTSDVELLEVFFAHTISPVAIALVTSALMVCFVGGFAWQLGLVAALAYLFVGACVPLVASRLSGGEGRASRDRAAGLSTFVLDGLRGLEEVLQFGAGPARLERLDALSRELVASQGRLRGVAAMGEGMAGVAITLFSLAELLVGISLMRAGMVCADAVLVSTIALFSSFGPVVALANLGSTLQGTLASANRVLDILDEEPVVEDVLEGEEPEFDGATLRHVSFSYDEERILDDVSLDIPRGGIVGVTGRSGSGKSTLCRLLMRFWDPDRGQIAVSDSRLDAIATSHLRGLEALVEQDCCLFHDSIRDNLLIAKPDATQEELERACRAASVHDFIMSLPEGYDSMVGELGDTLSGGERQRLGLARAFLHDAPLLILDEPTSNLDSLNEGIILRSLDAQRAKRTVLLVSHRASTMAVAEHAVSMDSGRMS